LTYNLKSVSSAIPDISHHYNSELSTGRNRTVRWADRQTDRPCNPLRDLPQAGPHNKIKFTEGQKCQIKIKIKFTKKQNVKSKPRVSYFTNGCKITV